MSDSIAQSLLAGRIGAQDRLIGVLLVAVTMKHRPALATLCDLIDEQAIDARSGGAHEEAAYLSARATSLRARG